MKSYSKDVSEQGCIQGVDSIPTRQLVLGDGRTVYSRLAEPKMYFGIGKKRGPWTAGKALQVIAAKHHECRHVQQLFGLVKTVSRDIDLIGLSMLATASNRNIYDSNYSSWPFELDAFSFGYKKAKEFAMEHDEYGKAALLYMYENSIGGEGARIGSVELVVDNFVKALDSLKKNPNRIELTDTDLLSECDSIIAVINSDISSLDLDAFNSLDAIEQQKAMATAGYCLVPTLRNRSIAYDALAEREIRIHPEWFSKELSGKIDFVLEGERYQSVIDDGTCVNALNDSIELPEDSILKLSKSKRIIFE